MRSAWNPAKEVRWRMLEDNLFTVQFGCLGDWNMAIQDDPWLFRNHALIIKEYDGFENPRLVKLDKIAGWARVLKLPDNYLKAAVIKGMCGKMGTISEVQITLPAGVSMKSFSNTHIDVLIQNDELGDLEWRFTGFYGNPERSKRKLSWDLLKYLRREYNNPWICAGDFNEEIRVVLSVKIPALHPSTWAIDIIDSNKVDPRVVAIILCGGWTVWAERNARDHGESTRSIAQSVKWTADITRDLAESVRVKTSGHPERRSKWRRPKEGVIKINVDAGFDLNNGEGSSGLIVRDHDSAMLRGQAIWYSHGASSLTMEALAVRDDVKLANDLGITRIEVETDAIEVVKLWNERRQGRSEIYSIQLEIEELSSNMDSFQLGYIGREANEGAHLCAKQASACRRRCLWIN
ncbi:hypothetical protein QYE76_025574 [Lolium multiflorum]|uniref:RNase H type-1 domain-containing protein n=1 Tax=Lolium multiflorum TaxID=4521 RepID=A0AAD8VUE1_LOLMU|nr:hypothetical protein QYE76_025574 [Lolium multiflorum]